MEISRRQFLKMAGLASAGVVAIGSAGSILTACSPVNEVGDPRAKGAQMSMLFVPSRCDDGCTDCILACHQNHNVPDLKDKDHEIKWIWNTEFQHAFTEYMENDLLKERMEGVPFLVLCNHCSNPACVRVCPTKATFKREDGIVMMDYHRCIGCRFCVAACPYGARSFNFEDPRDSLPTLVNNPNYPTRTKGVVEKCTFCAELDLYGGELPYCVQACIKKRGSHEESALVFGNMADEHSTIRAVLEHLQKEEKMIPLRRKEIAGTQPKVYYLT